MTDPLNRNLPPHPSLARGRSEVSHLPTSSAARDGLQVLALLAQPFVILDLETTGLDPTQHEIIEIAALTVHAGFQVADEFHVLIKPSQALPSEISALTGIAQSLLDNSGVTLHEGLAGLQAFLGRLPVFAHYAPFDQGFLRHAAKQCGVSFENTTFDAIDVAKAAWPGLGSYSLGDLAQWLGICRPTHRALSDAKATLAMLVKAYDTLIASSA